MKLSVIMPVYNEINTILEIIRKVKEVPIDKEIIIVDDGSTDGTSDVLKGIDDENIKVILSEKNVGKGHALKIGMKHASGDIVIIQDADLEYYPDEYPLLINKIIDGKADVVYGTRFLGAHRVFLYYHYLGNKLLNTIANILYDANLSDYMTCYKAFRIDIAKKLNFAAKGFGIESEITAQILKMHYRLYEVPISYDGRSYDEGKKITWKDFFRSLYWLIVYKFKAVDMGMDTLFRMKVMKNNNKWTFSQIKPYLGNSILEIGAGIGTISQHLSSLNKNLVLTDVNERYTEILRHRFLSNPRVKIFDHDIVEHEVSRFKNFNIDTVVCINMLEHVADDVRVLKNIFSILNAGGYLILLVPALKKLFGSLDVELKHFTRYEKNELISKLESNNFEVERIFYMNFFATIGWFINGRVLRKKNMSRFQIVFFDKFIPLFASIEKIVKIPFGLSLVAICKKKNVS